MALGAAFMLTVSAAGAEEPDASCRSGRPWVKMIMPGALGPDVGQFVGLLRAELSTRGLDLCTSSPTPPLATIQFSPGPNSVSLSVEVHDALTEKRLSRDVELAGVPPDGKSLTVALAADELLRASWAELTLRTAPPPSLPVPREVTEAVRDATMPAPRRLSFGMAFAAEHFASGTSLYGADVDVAAWLSQRLSLGLRVGLRTSTALAAKDGEVRTSAFAASVFLAFTLTPPERRWGIDALALTGFESLTFAPTAGAGATGAPASDLAWLVEIGPAAWVRVLPGLRLGLEALGALPARPVHVTDAHEDVGGVAGPGIAGSLFASGAF